jgi:hemoglobin
LTRPQGFRDGDRERDKGMGITDADFNALVEDLSAPDKFKVGAKETGDLLAALGPLKKDIVEK